MAAAVNQASNVRAGGLQWDFSGPAVSVPLCAFVTVGGLEGCAMSKAGQPYRPVRKVYQPLKHLAVRQGGDEASFDGDTPLTSVTKQRDFFEGAPSPHGDRGQGSRARPAPTPSPAQNPAAVNAPHTSASPVGFHPAPRPLGAAPQTPRRCGASPPQKPACSAKSSGSGLEPGLLHHLVSLHGLGDHVIALGAFENVSALLDR